MSSFTEPVTFRQAIDHGQMSPYQWIVIAICVLLNVVDGFDILVMAFTATGVTNEWGLTGAQLGLLLSSGLVGMALGTLLVAPQADRFGRRPVVLLSLIVVAIGMVAAAVSTGPAMLGAIRVVTGLGMGGVIVCASVMASEFSSNRWRGLAVGLNTLGYAFGASMGGVVAVALQGAYSWRAVFWFGAGLTLLSLVTCALFMPESPDVLVRSVRAGADERLRRLSARMGVEGIDLHATSGATAGHRARAVEAFRKPHRRSAIVMCLVFFCTMFGYYVVQSWTPRLLVLSGLSVNQGNLGGTLVNLGGMAGAVMMGLIAARFPIRWVLLAFQLLAGLLLIVFSVSSGATAVAFVLATLIGVGANGCIAGAFALTTALFPGDIRATAMGLATTFGRVGAIIAPTIVGRLVDLHWTISALYASMSIFFFLAAGILTQIRPAGRDAPDRR